MEESSKTNITAAATTNTTLLVGKTRRGPFKPARISSFHQFEVIFGGLWKRSTLPYSVEQYFQNGGADAIIQRQHSQEGYKELFDRLEKSNVQFNLFCIPFTEREDPDDEDSFFNIIVPRGLALCEKKRAIFIIDPPLSWDTVEKAKEGWKRLAKGSFGALYFPRVLFENRLTGGQGLFPPSGAIAGLFARNDRTHGVWKSPAGVDADILGARGLQIDLSDFQQSQLNETTINSIRRFDARFVVWGARTLGDNTSGSEWKYVSVRRFAIFMEESIDKGTQWAVFEPNDEQLWSRLRMQISAFMQDLFRQGAFQGSSPKEAFFVKCDRETMTQSDIDGGFVNILVGFAPLKPAEFVVLTISTRAKSVHDPDP